MSETATNGVQVKTCECGCGEDVRPGKRFRQGHAARFHAKNGTLKKRRKKRNAKTIHQQTAAVANGMVFVAHQPHYGGADNPYEAIKVIAAWGLNFNTGNCAKYICRAGKKEGVPGVEDLKKARFYLDMEIERLSAK